MCEDDILTCLRSQKSLVGSNMTNDRGVNYFSVLYTGSFYFPLLDVHFSCTKLLTTVVSSEVLPISIQDVSICNTNHDII